MSSPVYLLATQYQLTSVRVPLSRPCRAASLLGTLGFLLAAVTAAPTSLLAQSVPPATTAAATASGPAVTPAEIYGYWGLDQATVDAVTSRMEKEAVTDANKANELKLFMPAMKMMLNDFLFIIKESEVVEFRMNKAKSTPSKITQIEGRTFTMEGGQRSQKFSLENGKLINLGMVDPKVGPVFVLRKLNEDEVKAWDIRIEESTRPPTADAPAEKRLNFWAFDATVAQAEAMLKAQPDLITVKNARGENALAMTLRASGVSAADKLAKVEQLLTAGADINSAVVNGEPVLFGLLIFSPDQNLETFKVLAKHGADLKAVNQQGETLLMQYCRNGRKAEFISWLIDQGIPVNAVTPFKQTALSAAVQAKWVEGARVLLDHGADLALYPNLLEWAANNFDLPTLKLLYERGLKQDSFGNTLLTVTVCRLQRPAPPVKDDKRQAELLAQAQMQRQVVLDLIELAKDLVQVRNKAGNTPLSLASDLAVAKALIAAGADPKAEPGQFGDTPLCHAAWTSPELTRFYVEQGLDINALSNHGPALNYALSVDGNQETVAYLVEKGAHLNRPGPHDYSCLASAIRLNGKDSAAYVDFLLGKGADPKLQTLNNIDACVRAKSPELLRTLVKAGMVLNGDYSTSWQSPLTYAVDDKSVDMVKAMLELGAEPFAKTASEQSVVERVQDPAKFSTNTPEAKAIFDLLTALKPAAN
jgi:ankyrin repeat protein